MDSWMYHAAFYCGACVPVQVGAEDSDGGPQGPFLDGGGEADCPQHCDKCQVFLENPLTADGREYVKNAILHALDSRRKDHAVVKEWAEFYGITLKDLWGV